MEVIPLAFDSMGVRSMATYVKCKHMRVLIDPGASLAPSRFSLPPHPIELKKLAESWKSIVCHAKKSDVLIITHFHYDHYNPWENLEIYVGKVVLIKHPKEKINFSQKKRAAYFLDKIKDLPKRLEFADGRTFDFKGVRIKFSHSVFHGTNQRLGYVTEVLIEETHKVVFTSDVEGPAIKEQVDFILENDPDFLIVDAPMTYMLGYRYSHESLHASVENLIKIMKETRVRNLIVDHHFMRDLNFKEKLSSVFEVGRKMGIKVMSAAEFLGKPVEMLEARRRELYLRYPKSPKSRFQ